MTLRDIGEGISEATHELGGTIQSGSVAMETQSPLDWPLWLIIVVAIFGIYVFFLILSAMTGIGGAISAHNAEMRALDRKISKIPTDPQERLLWANREGKYRDKSE